MTTARRHPAGGPSTAHGMTSRLLVLTDRSQLPLGRSLLATLAACAEAGVETVVVRELDLPDEHRAALATRIAALGVTVVAAHRPLPGAAGVHLPAAAPPVGPGRLVGRSCHTAEEVRRAAGAGATYATLGPFAATASKPGYGPPIEPGALAGHAIPVYALGGIDAANAATARAHGAHGVAVMGAVMRAADPAAVARELLEAVRP